MDLQIRETVEIYGSTKQISTEKLLSAILDSKKIGKILGEYKNLGKVISRSLEELKLLGFNNDEAIKIKILSEIINRITTPEKKIHFGCPQEIADFLIPRLRYLEKEHFVVCSLNTKNEMTNYKIVSTGTLTNSIVHPREVFIEALKNKAAALIVAHNHPSGNPSPSENDNNLTKALKEAGKTMGIPILDHLIIGDGAYYSYSESIDDWFDNWQLKKIRVKWTKEHIYKTLKEKI